MLPYRDSTLTRIALSVFFVLVLAYGYYEARGMLYGPNIIVTTGTTEVHDPYVTIRGHADRIASLTMNGGAVPVTEDGAFDEPYLLAPGLNRITLEAADKYGRHRQKVMEIVYIPDNTPVPARAPATQATTTATTSNATP